MELGDKNLESGMWEQKSGALIKVSDMTLSHLNATRRLCQNLSETATFSCDSEKWDSWIEIFDSEILQRPQVKKTAASNKPPQKTRGAKTKMKCHCGNVYEARNADLKRGWAKSCGKRCASIRREYGRPSASVVKLK